MHIGFHQLCNNVNVLIVCLLGWLGHVQHLDYILMIEELKQTNLSHNTFRID